MMSKKKVGTKRHALGALQEAGQFPTLLNLSWAVCVEQTIY